MPSDTFAALVRKPKRFPTWLAAALIVPAAAALLYLFPNYRSYTLSSMIGAAVGASELLARYRYTPTRALRTPGGLVFVSVNGLAALFAYHLIATRAIPNDLQIDSPASIIFAGVGALAFLRLSLFRVRIEDKDIGVGPAALLDALLVIADRDVDRREAVYRAREITAILTGVAPDRAAALLTSYCLALMQNVDETEKQKLIESTRKIAQEPDIPSEIKGDLIALALSNSVGPDVLQAAVEALGERLREVRSSSGATPVPAPLAANIPDRNDLLKEIEGRTTPDAAGVRTTHAAKVS